MTTIGNPELDVVRDFLDHCLVFEALPGQTRDDCARQMAVRYFPAPHQFEIETAPHGIVTLRSGLVDILVDGQLQQRLDAGDSFTLPLPDMGCGQWQAKVAEDCLIYLLPEEASLALRRDFPQLEDLLALNPLARQPLLPNAKEPPPNTDGLHLLLQPLQQWMSQNLVTVTPEQRVIDAAQSMTARRVSSVLVVSQSDELMGIVTDRDIRSRLVAEGGSGEQSVQRIMTPTPLTLTPEHTLFDATLLMSQRGIHHLPIAQQGKALGMITASDVFLAREEDPVFFVQHLGRQQDVAGLRQMLSGLPRLFVHWVRGGLPAEHIGRLSNMVSEAATRRLIELGIERLGPPPGAFCWLSFGSQARGEQLLGGDQDNGLVIDDSVAETDLPWFAALAQWVCEGLDACGYVFCPGEVMASNPQWCQRLSQWQATVDQWMTSPTPAAVMRVSIFFDLRGIWGDTTLSRAVQHHMLTHAKSNSIFQAALARNVLESSPPLGLLRQFVVERNGEHRDQFNLKKRGILPLIELVRLRALSAGVPALGTLDRLAALKALGHMNPADADGLTEACRVISRLRIELQADQVSRGEAVHNYCDPKALSRLTRHNLRGAFAVIHDAQASVRLHYLQGQG